MLSEEDWAQRYGRGPQWDKQARKGARWYSLLEFARQVGAMDTAFDLLTLLSLAYTPKKMAEDVFAAFVAGILRRKGFNAVVENYIQYSSRMCVIN